MLKRGVEVSVKFDGELKRLASVDRKIIAEAVKDLVRKRERVFNGGVLNLDIKQNDRKFRNIPLFFCRARLWKPGKLVVAKGSEYGVWQTVDKALDRIESRLILEKERGLRF